ncbi:cation-translocating P-type ATPase [Nitrosophilus kaiyonis]|uniref:cation-translocating P-type ATPase n=1 Tax=Nitrosophilus kaiyonis TaxID=2930200 RepID=UPI002491AA60|nr:cation-transporting P-type ATPase [Nitrosophilus kaiyonis]
MKPFKLSKEKLFLEFRTSKNGLSKKEVKKRLKDFGFNIIQTRKKKNYIKEYLKEYTEFFPILLIIAGILALIADYFQPNEGNDILAYAIFGAVFINANFTFWQKYKADKTMEALLQLMPTYVKVRREGKIFKIDSKELVPGDIMILEEGDKIAADGVLIEVNNFYIDTSAIDGESKPKKREIYPGDAKREIDAKNMVYAGCVVVRGSAEAVVVATSMATEFGKIATLTQNVQKSLTPLEKEIIRMTKILTILALLAGVVFFVLGILSNKGFLIASIFALSLIVANVPEGLLPTITLSLSLAAQRMAKRKALIKNLASVQTLGSVTTICTDKTGTLTKNQMTVKEIYLANGDDIEVTGEGYEIEGEFIFKNRYTDKQLLKDLLIAGWCNSRAIVEKDKAIGDPTEIALVVAAKKYKIDIKNCKKIKENPFSSERKMMSTLVEIDNKKVLYVKGAPEKILERSTHFYNGKNIIKLDTTAKKRFENKLEELESRAFRVLTIAIGKEDKEENLTILGFVAMKDPPREEVKEAVEKCYQAKIKIMMITGDNAITAKAIAKEIGLQFDGVLTGDEIEKVDEEKLQEILKNKVYIFARMASAQKLKIASALQKNGEVVAMTGDGVNDAPALKKADIGVGMGSGTDVAKEASDMILLDDNFRSIVAAIEEGRTVYFNIKKFVTYILSSNVPEIVPYVLSFFLKIPNPLSVIQILSIDLGSDMLPGLALGSEKPEKNIMNRPPVGKKEKILDFEVFKRGYFMLGVIEASAAMFAFITFLLNHGWHYGEVHISDPILYRQAMTMTLLGAVTCQLANVWTLRSWDFNIWEIDLKSNKLLFFAMFAVFVWIWALLNVPVVQKIFNTAHVPIQDLWVLLPFPIILFITNETYKYIKKRKILI